MCQHTCIKMQKDCILGLKYGKKHANTLGFLCFQNTVQAYLIEFYN